MNFRDGIYRLTYPIRSSGRFETALAVVRDGTVLASDPHGGVYRSTGAEPCADSRFRILIHCLIPPDGELATGQIAGPGGLDLTTEAVFDPNLDAQTINAVIGGEKLDIEVVYLGPLPN